MPLYGHRRAEEPMIPHCHPKEGATPKVCFICNWLVVAGNGDFCLTGMCVTEPSVCVSCAFPVDYGPSTPNLRSWPQPCKP